VLIANQASWRITSVDQSWEEITGLNADRISSPPGLPAVWYAWRGSAPNTHLYKTTDNGTSWTQLASDPMVPTSAVAGAWAVWEDHLTAATDGILITSEYSSTGHPGNLRLKNIHYSIDDGASWSQVFETDLDWADGGDWAKEGLVANTVYSWFRGNGNNVQRVSHGGGLASLTEIALPSGYATPIMLACDSTLAGKIVYGVSSTIGDVPRIIRTSPLNGELFVDITPPWDIDNADLGNVWIAVAGDTVIALASGFVDPDDTSSIWRSTNAGVTWTKVRDWNADLDSFFTFAGYKAVGVSPNRPQTWFVWANNHEAIGSKVMRSTDNGASWSFVNLPSADPGGDDDQLYNDLRVLG
jgi:hypothetical protein